MEATSGSTVNSGTGRCQRAAGAIVGCILADAAAVPVHWVYDMNKLASLQSEADEIAFLEKSANPFYNIPTGKSGCYGDQVVILLESMARCRGFDESDYKHRLYKHFGPGSEYDVERILGHAPSRGDFPIPCSWRNQSIKHFLRAYEKNMVNTGDPTDAQGDSYSKVAPVVAMYAGRHDMLDIVERAVRVTQDNDTAVRCAKAGALILEQYVLYGRRESNVVDTVLPRLEAEMISHVQKMRGMASQPHSKVVPQLGNSCLLPGSFLNALHCVFQSDGNFTEAVCTTILAGGCNCSRSCFVGACLGALKGIEGLPQEWLQKLCNVDSIVDNAKVLGSLVNGS